MHTATELVDQIVRYRNRLLELQNRIEAMDTYDFDCEGELQEVDDALDAFESTIESL